MSLPTRVFSASTAELAASGFSQRQIEASVRSGGLRRVSHGVFVRPDGEAREEREGAIGEHLTRAAAVARTLPGCYLVGTSGLLAHGLPVQHVPREVFLARGSRLNSRRADVVGRRSWQHPVTRSAEFDVDVQDPTAAIVETAAHGGALAGLIAADAAARRGILTDSNGMLAAWGARTGVKSARLAFEHVDGRRESPLETWAAWEARLAGIILEPQSVIRDVGGEWVARVDFTVKGAKVVVEVDGIGKYRDHRAFKDERVRHNQIEELGWIVVRVTIEELRTGRFVPRLTAAVARAGAR